MSTDARIRRNLALVAVVGVWPAVIAARALHWLDCSWWWVLAPYWVPLAALGLFTVVCVALTLLMRWWLWLVVRAERRRRFREVCEILRAMENGLSDLAQPRPPRVREQPSTRHLRS